MVGHVLADRRLVAYITFRPTYFLEHLFLVLQTLTPMKSKVFISWSGPRSQRVATALRDWLPDILQNVVPFVSEEDIAKGRRGTEVIASELRESAIGIICLTPENLSAPWILFEAGALSSSLQRREMVCPYLLGVEKRNVQLPLAQFQLTSADKEDTRRLAHAINASFQGEYQSGAEQLDRRFEKWWPDLDSVLQAILGPPLPEGLEPPIRSTEDVLTEVLETVRQLSRALAPSRTLELSAGEPEVDPENVLPGRTIIFNVGDRVLHPKFGEGTVAAMSGVGSGSIATVDFDTSGRKRLVPVFARLQAISPE